MERERKEQTSKLNLFDSNSCHQQQHFSSFPAQSSSCSHPRTSPPDSSSPYPSQPRVVQENPATTKARSSHPLPPSPAQPALSPQRPALPSSFRALLSALWTRHRDPLTQGLRRAARRLRSRRMACCAGCMVMMRRKSEEGRSGRVLVGRMCHCWCGDSGWIGWCTKMERSMWLRTTKASRKSKNWLKLSLVAMMGWRLRMSLKRLMLLTRKSRYASF